MLKTTRCVLVTVLGIVLVFGCDPSAQICSNESITIARQIKDKLMEILKTTTQLDYLRNAFSADSDLIRYEEIDGKKLLKDAQLKLETILKNKTDAVDKIADFVRQKSPGRLEQARDPPTCSYLLAKDRDMEKKINLTYYEEFKARVNLTETIIHFPVDVYEFSNEIKSAIHLTDGLDQVFVKNYERDKFIFAQYFGSTSGLLRYFPAYSWLLPNNQTDLYDCRFRSWYIEAAGQPRDVVFLMDTSGSMYGWALRVAKYTAKTLLQIVSDKDYVAFYTFNLTTQSLSCYPQLERARLKYINHLYEEIDKIDAIGASNFSIALNTAFDVLENSARNNKTCDCQRSIIIFSDYVREEYVELLKKRNPDGKVRIFILAFGAPNQGDTTKLEKIACANNGYFSKVYDYGDVVPAISNILAVFGQPLSLNTANIQATWSTVYYEYDRQNFVMTVGKSVVLDHDPNSQREPFLGVAAIDVDIPQMKNIMTGMFSGIMYAFMINNNVILHPRMVPIDDYTEKPDMDINEMEITEDPEKIKEIARSMLNRNTGSIVTRSLVYFKNTISGRENYQNTEYFFTSLDGYPFSIGIIVPESERQEIKVDISNKALDKTLVMEAIQKEVPGRLRWKKYPLCTKNLTDTIKPVLTKAEKAELEADPCYPDRYSTMAAEVLLTQNISDWWQSEKFRNWTRAEVCNFNEHCILDAYLVTNAGIIRTYRNMSNDSVVMDPVEMQPFIHSRKGIPANTLLVSLLGKDEEENGSRYFNISYSLGIAKESEIVQPLSVGVKVQLKALRYFIDVARKKRKATITLLDENAFTIFSTDEEYEPTPIERFYDKTSNVTNFILNESSFYYQYQVKDCQKLCKKTIPQVESSARSYLSPLRSVTKFMSSIWKLFVFFISDLFLDKGTANHRRATYVMCCEDEKTYFRNFSNTAPLEGTVDCGGICKKNVTLSPLPNTNVLLVIDNNPDCVCQRQKRTKSSYINELCENNHISQWRSDLSQQVCFEKFESNTTRTESKWKCSNTPP
ncbi:voltage-dependent calcium channel subunit alpha-2/delta-2-like isoform X1 [Bolinopsis microptera]|uniref:voltage-dependent calcium channel subunit alpha-2/delta-2-like isoform X1 n=1 Tax=Bolinopsis microptera TaxID=2820187 RepID=UPI00307A5601